MKIDLKTNLGRLRFVGILEAISWVVLFLGMYCKYVHGVKVATKVPGMLHGFLFVSYVILIYVCHEEYEWKFKKSITLFIGSLFPFGTIWTDKKVLDK